MKFVAIISGGKDSLYSIVECCRLGHELLGCVHLGAAENTEEESYMYQTAASEVITTLVEECLGVPLIFYQRVGKSINVSLVYQEARVGDEVEDLFQALTLAKEAFPDVQAVSSGAILSTYQRIRIEHVCSRLDLTSLSYLWRAAPQHDLLDRMIQDGIIAVLVRAACPPGLKPHKHLNKTLQELQPHFLLLNQRYQFHVCGEGGEYESLVVDCPLYKKRLVLDDVEVVELEGDEGVGVLKINKCHAEEKSGAVGDISSVPEAQRIQKQQPTCTMATPLTHSSDLDGPNSLNISYLPNVKCAGGGLWHVSELMVPIIPTPTSSEATEAELAVQEAQVVLETLGKLLQYHGCTAQDVLFVHLYLSEISHFASINGYYRQFFGTLLPPSRSCVAIGPNILPGGRRVSLDCMVQCGSGDYLRAKRGVSPSTDAALDNTSFRLREVLHVQSISHWAPVCVGPYSQTNTLRSGVHFLAGQIGLKPATMSLHADWKDQLQQCWANVASVLDALEGGSLRQLLSGVVYVADHVYHGQPGAYNEAVGDSPAIDIIASICNSELKRNGGIVPGKVDSPIAVPTEDDEDCCDVHDEATCPLLVVSIPEMPVGAVVEVEVISATLLSTSCLPLTDCSFSATNTTRGNAPMWDTGYSFPDALACRKPSNINIQIHMRSLGYGCASVVTVTAHCHPNENGSAVELDVDTRLVVHDMVEGLSGALAGEGGSPTGFHSRNALHGRLYYLASKVDCASGEKTLQDDGLLVRLSLEASLATLCDSPSSGAGSLRPTLSVIPVQAITQLHVTNKNDGHESLSTTTAIMALQVFVIDPVHLETELWIHHGRE